jgi:hypothetical protein
MDAIELARQTAAQWHVKAVTAGADPWVPTNLVSAVAGLLGLGVEPVLPGFE